MSDDPGKVEIRRQLQLGRPLGEGTVGQVYEGFEPGLGAHAAVKVLRADWLEEAEVRGRFEEEARLMASIDHPGCLPILGWGVDAEGRPFYAMRRIGGSTLGQAMSQGSESRRSLVRRRRFLQVFSSVCDTIAHTHRQGIVHRDLKPENIMIDPYGSVYVIDWGFAKRLDGGGDSTAVRTVAHAVMGSPGYMSPEQAEGRAAKVGPEADVFALGAILYEILTGESPFRADSVREAMAHAIHKEPKPPGLRDFVGRSLSAVCMKALHKDPGRRYPDAGALAADVRAHLEGRPVSVVKPHLGEKLLFRARRQPGRTAVAWALALVVLIGLCLVGVQAWVDHRLADKSWEQLEEIDRDIAELDGEIAAMAVGGGTGELEVLRARRSMRQIQALSTLRNVKRLRFIRADPRIDSEWRRRFFVLLESSGGSDHALLVHALADGLLEDIEEGTAAIEFRPEDVDRLRAALPRIREASRLPD